MKFLAKIQSRPAAELNDNALFTYPPSHLHRCECGAQCVESPRRVYCPECLVYWRKPIYEEMCIDDQEVA